MKHLSGCHAACVLQRGGAAGEDEWLLVISKLAIIIGDVVASFFAG